MDNVEQHSPENVEKVEQPTNENDPKNEISLMDQIEQLKSTNNRLLAQSKENADKYRSLRDQNDAKTKLELEENENWKTLLDNEKNEHSKLRDDFNSLRKTTLKKDLDFTVAKMIDKPLTNGFTIDDVIDQVLKTGIVEVSDDDSGFLNVADAFNKVKETKPALFNTTKIPMTNKVPDGGEPKSKTFAELSVDERTKLRSDLIKDKYPTR